MVHLMNQRGILEPSETSMRENFCKIVNGYKPLITFAKRLHRRCSTWF